MAKGASASSCSTSRTAASQSCTLCGRTRKGLPCPAESTRSGTGVTTTGFWLESSSILLIELVVGGFDFLFFVLECVGFIEVLLFTI